MLALGGGKIFLYRHPVDFRKGFEGLSFFVGSTFQEPITGNAYFIFLNRTEDRMKVLYFDMDGLVIWYKRLEKGRFPERGRENRIIDRREFLMLLEGIVPYRLHRRFKPA